MKKDFRLENVLDFRNRKLEAEKSKMQILLNRDNALRNLISQTQGLIEEKQLEMDSDISHGMLGFVNLYAKFISLKEEHKKDLQLSRVEVLKDIENQKNILGKFLKDVKIIEKLKEKHLINYASYLNKLEEKNIDEVNITRKKDEERL